MTPKRTRRLRARAAAMNSHEAEFEDYGPEPNMKLSHAFLVVLLLHVIAVGGLYAFNTYKAGKAPKLTLAKTSAPAEQPAEPSSPQGEKPNGPNDPNNLPPSGKKAPLVAKTANASEAPKVVEKEALKPVPQKSKGLLASAKAALMRATGLGAAGGAGALATASAQEAAVPAAAPQPTEPATVAAAPVARSGYVVKSGDTITKIAASLGVSIPALEAANNLAGSSVLRVGQTLKVPAPQPVQPAVEAPAQDASVAGVPQAAPVSGTSATPGSLASVVATAAAASTQAGGAVSAAVPAASNLAEYTVVKGDNPYKIAKKFKITPEELMKINGITDPKKIQIGQKLKIPVSQKKAAK